MTSYNELNSFLVDNSTTMSSADCKRQTTKVHNIPDPHSTGHSTISSSISRYPFSSSHHSTKTWKTNNKGGDLYIE
jgi:hypothetical protein